MNRVLLCIIVLSIPHTLVFCVVHRMSVFLNNAEIVSDPRYLNTSVRFSRHSVAPYFSFDMTFVVLQKLNDLRVQVRHIVPIAGINTTFYDVSLDFCAFLKRPTDRIMKMIFQDIKEHGPMPTSCPIFAQRAVFSNISLDSIKLPLYIPETRFQLLVEAWTKQGKIIIYEGRWFGRMKKIVISNE